MLLPLETIAIILYLASITTETIAYSLNETLFFILGVMLSCMALVSIQSFFLLKRTSLHTKVSRRISSLCESFNKLLSCAATLFLLNETSSQNIYTSIFPDISFSYTLSNITGMLIYILITLCTWIPWFYIHRKVSPGFWTHRSYLVHKFRYTFFILGIWLPGILLTQYIDSEDSLIKGNDIEIYSSVLIAFVAWVFPVFLKKFWGCKELEDDELRKEIDELASKAGVKVRSICMWSLGGKSIPNAAMVGFLPPFQYLFISHGLNNRLSREEVLGVVAHELGHLKKRHILFYLVMSISLLGAIEPIIYQILQNRIYTIVGIVGLFFLYIRFIFAWVSRRFEREADLFSAELMEDYRPLSRGLERIGIACGNIRNESSWHHYGISERVRFLESSFHNAAIKHHFKAGLKFTKIAALLLFTLLITYTYYIRPNMQAQAESLRNTQRMIMSKPIIDYNKHWQEVDAVLLDEDIQESVIINNNNKHSEE